MDEPLHSLLRRQLKRHHPDAIPEEWRPFIAAVSQAYYQSDVDRQMLERSLDLSSEELGQANSQMRRAVAALQEARADLETRVDERTKALATAENRLRQAQKMEAIGRLAGGIAHDFNNLLTVIYGQAELLLEEELAEDTRGSVTEIRQAAESAASLTQQLLAFSRQQALALTVLDVNELVRSTNSLLRRLIGEDVELVAHLSPGVGMVRVDRGQFQQVLLNLGVNARDAMPQGGQLTIATANSVVDEHTSQPTYIRPGSYVALTVSDTGIGMNEDVRARIFEPFFTTKSLNRGTGLGLATVYGIVKQSDGYIDVVSEPNQGATFNILLPQVDESVQPHAAASRRTGTAVGCILVVEDQEPVRRVICQRLLQAGYNVLEAHNGPVALEIASAAAHIDLLLTDVVMPHMSGRTLAVRLANDRPLLKVLYMTGYSDDAEVAREIRDRSRPLLQKPFNADTLLHAVQSVLSEPATHPH